MFGVVLRGVGKAACPGQERGTASARRRRNGPRERSTLAVPRSFVRVRELLGDLAPEERPMELPPGGVIGPQLAGVGLGSNPRPSQPKEFVGACGGGAEVGHGLTVLDDQHPPPGTKRAPDRVEPGLPTGLVPQHCDEDHGGSRAQCRPVFDRVTHHPPGAHPFLRRVGTGLSDGRRVEVDPREGPPVADLRQSPQPEAFAAAELDDRVVG